jgi:hypothetical protein
MRIEQPPALAVDHHVVSRDPTPTQDMDATVQLASTSYPGTSIWRQLALPAPEGGDGLLGRGAVGGRAVRSRPKVRGEVGQVHTRCAASGARWATRRCTRRRAGAPHGCPGGCRRSVDGPRWPSRRCPAPRPAVDHLDRSAWGRSVTPGCWRRSRARRVLAGSGRPRRSSGSPAGPYARAQVSQRRLGLGDVLA